MALVNEHEARRTGGTFTVRFADNARWVVSEHGGQAGMSEYALQQRNELEWLGIEPDYYSFESDSEYKAKRYLASHPKFNMVIDHAGTDTNDTKPEVRAFEMAAAMRMTAWITAQKVLIDNWQGCDTLIRGIDLLTEHHLYMYFCALFGYPFPKCYYLPRLMAIRSGRRVNISKTDGNWRIADFKGAGRSPDEVRDLLNRSCKICPDEPWYITNIKESPVVADES
jgi:glutamyl/glutaminyl-tRNA synthetase